MLKKLAAAAVVLVTFATSVFAAKAPIWMADRDAAFPDSKYIARVGRGADPESAKARALGDIAGYFKSQVVAETKANQKMSYVNGDVSREQSIDQTTQVISQMDLVAVDYSTAYYNKKEGMYYVAAFIDRALAWDVYEPEVLQAQNRYESLYDLAMSTKEKVLRYKYLYKSRDASQDFITKLYFGFLINPSKKKEYSEIIYEISNDGIFGTLEQQDMHLYLSVPGDQGGIITSAMTDIFSDFGFIVATKSGASSEYTLLVEIDDNEVINDDVHAIYPYLEIKLTNMDGTDTFYTWNKRWTKTANFSLRQCQQRAYPKMVEEIKKSVPSDYRKHLMTE